MLPNFLVIGAAKAGTTSLYEYLRAHPQVFMSTPKELNYFSQDDNLAKGLGWYKSHFADAGDAIAIGENSPQYSIHPWARIAPRVAEVIPDAKLIYLVRHPIERILSHYRWHVAHGEMTDPIGKAVRKRGPHGEDPFYVISSSYALQIEAYLEHFPRERMLVITTEDLRDHRARTMRRVFTFLGVDPDAQPDTLGQEFNRSERLLNRRLPRASWLAPERRTRLPGYGAVRLLPPGVRARARTLITRGVQVSMPDDVAAWLADRLRDDVTRLADYMEPGWDAWGLLGDRTGERG